MRCIAENTSIPVAKVYGYDSRFTNPVGVPYIFMEAMTGKRLYGGGRADFIPDQHKRKVYGQIADILPELYRHPFDKVDMLWDSTENGVHVGAMHDQKFRLEPYGPFQTSLDSYQVRAQKLASYKAAKDLSGKEHPDCIRLRTYRMPAVF